MSGSEGRGIAGSGGMIGLLRVATAPLAPSVGSDSSPVGPGLETAGGADPGPGGASKAPRNGSAAGEGALRQAKRAAAGFGALEPTAIWVVPITVRVVPRTATTVIR